MTPEQHIQITSAVLAQLQLIIVAAGGLIVLGFTYFATRLHDALLRLDRQAVTVNELQNNGGDNKIELKVMSMIGQGKIPAPSVTSPGLSVASPGSLVTVPVIPPTSPPQEGTQ